VRLRAYDFSQHERCFQGKLHTRFDYLIKTNGAQMGVPIIVSMQTNLNKPFTGKENPMQV